MRGSFVAVNCSRCHKPFAARVADRNRGWGKFCSKSCKAIKQAQETYGSVDAETYRHYSDKYGGMPVFDSRGEYEGFVFERASYEDDF